MRVWLLLQWHALQEKCKRLEDDKSRLFVEMTCFKIGKTWCPNRWCHFDELVLTLEKASRGDDTDHSYTPSLVLPFKSVAPMRRSFIRKEDGKNSIETLLEIQSLEIEIKFFFMLGTQRTLVKENWALEVWIEREPVCVMGSPVPSPIIMSSEPLYGAWIERLLKLEVTWWEAPLSNSHVGVLEVLAAKWAFGCQEEFGVAVEVLVDVLIGINLKEGQRLAVCP